MLVTFITNKNNMQNQPTYDDATSETVNPRGVCVKVAGKWTEDAINVTNATPQNTNLGTGHNGAQCLCCSPNMAVWLYSQYFPVI
jgi:hypothetical protein